MSEVLEMVFEVAFNIFGCVLEILAEAWLGDFDWPDTKASRAILCAIITLLGVLIYWELR